jgi:hypothetical protein
MNNNTILALVFLMAGTLLTAAVATIGVPAAYAEDDHDDYNGDGNKNKAEDESQAALADCDDNDVEQAGFDCVAVAEIEEGGGMTVATPITPSTTEAAEEEEEEEE